MRDCRLAGERALELEPVNPNEVLQEAFESMEEIADRKGIKIECLLDDRMIPIPLDRHALYRGILNLASNAIEACLESDQGNRVTLKSNLKSGYVLLTVEDNGIGMTPDVLKRITERFYTTKPSAGTGLGLAVTKKIAEKHGGKLEVESVYGKGSSFHIRLPRL